MALKNKANYQIKTQDGSEFDLYVVEDFQIQSQQSIIVYESATGDGGYSLSNGRLQEDQPVNGTLFAEDGTKLLAALTKLKNISDNGEPIDFITPFPVGNRSNKWYMKNINFGFIHGGDNNCSFSMTLTEVREANVQKISVNLVNFETAQSMVSLYDTTIGNV